jgi:hypothetical protein
MHISAFGKLKRGAEGRIEERKRIERRSKGVKDRGREGKLKLSLCLTN